MVKVTMQRAKAIFIRKEHEFGVEGSNPWIGSMTDERAVVEVVAIYSVYDHENALWPLGGRTLLDLGIYQAQRFPLVEYECHFTKIAGYMCI
jgi:hypothetical protein